MYEINMTEELKKEKTFQYQISCLNRMLEETKKDIDVISKNVTNDESTDSK